MAATIEEIAKRVKRIRERSHQRDARWDDLLSIRKGNISEVFPSLFSDDYPKPMVANFIDVAARDIAEVIAPLPTFSCMTNKPNSDTKRKEADRRTQIAAGYRDACNLQTKMYSGADNYITFGMLPFIIEADEVGKRPMIRLESPIGGYPEFDRFNRLISYTKRYFKTVQDLLNDFPEYEGQILNQYEQRNSQRQIEMYRYIDKDQTVLFLPTQKNLVLAKVTNLLGEIPVVLAVRPGVDEETQHGQFDDIMWVQVAKGRFAALTLEAATKSVEAPIAMPNDVTSIEIGPDAVVRSATPEKIRRIDLNVPPGLLQESAELDHELMVGSRYPQGRLGEQSGSIVTGKGVQSLMGGFDTQIKTAQAVLADAFRQIMYLCFKMDEVYWPNESKFVSGINSGSPYELTYIPSRDINGNYHCDATYGLMAGLDPNRALVFGLQARGDKLVSRDFLQRNLPWEINITEETQQIQVEEMRDAAIGVMGALSQALPQMVMQGQDPSNILSGLATVIKGRQQGKQIEDLLEEAFAPTPPAQAPSGVVAAPGQQPTPGASGPQIAPPGASSNGQPPAMESLLAGMNQTGNPRLSAGLSRRSPV